MESVQDFREARGEAIARQFGWVRRMDEFSYKVHSQTAEKEYDVLSTEAGWSCGCPDFQFRGTKCKHIRAVELSFILRKIIAVPPLTIQAVSVKNCPTCNSESIVKHGVRHNDSGDIQRWSCKGCGKWFTINLGFEKMQATPQVITSAMQLYFTGESFRNVQKFLKLQGVEVSHVAVYTWVTKYIKLMEGYLDKLTPQLGDKWRADELYLKVKGNPKWLYAMIDDESRYWIAMQVGDKKWHEDVRPLWRDAKEIAGKQPKIMTTDGAENFATANRKEFYSRYADKNTKHIREIAFNGRYHNNLMERFNGELRDREKVMRSLKREDSPILKGMQIHHNFIRTHEGLDGKTPSEAAGIKVEGENKWLTIIQNATKAQEVKTE
jgi:putative transposase